MPSSAYYIGALFSARTFILYVLMFFGKGYVSFMHLNKYNLL